MKAFKVKYRYRGGLGTIWHRSFVLAASTIRVATLRGLRLVHEAAREHDEAATSVFMQSIKELGDFRR